MVVHKVVDRLSAWIAVPMALGKLRGMEKNPTFMTLTYMHGENYRVHLTHSPGTNQQYVRVDTLYEGPLYEFFATDKFVYVNENSYTLGGLGTPPFTSTLNSSYCCGHLVKVTAGKEFAPAMAGSWTGLNDATMVPYFAGARKAKIDGFNNQKQPFRQNWTTLSSLDNPVDAIYAMTLSVDCRYETDMPYFLTAGQATGYPTTTGDILWDLRQTTYYKTPKERFVPQAQTPLLPAPRWWRRGTVIQTPGGDVGVVTDSFNTFYFFKMDVVQTGDIVQNHPGNKSTRYVSLDNCVIVHDTSYMPAGIALCTHDTLSVYPILSSSNTTGSASMLGSVDVSSTPSYEVNSSVPNDSWQSTAPQNAMFQSNQVLWNFSGDGLRAVGIAAYDRGVLEWQPRTFDYAATENTMYRPVETVKKAKYDFLMPDVRIPADVRAALFADKEFVDHHVYTPALVELNIQANIDANGVLAASVTLLQMNKDKWFVAADYAYKHPDMPVAGGSLITAEIRSYVHNESGYGVDHSRHYGDESYCVGTLRVSSGATTLFETTITNTRRTFDSNYATTPTNGVNLQQYWDDPYVGLSARDVTSGAPQIAANYTNDGASGTISVDKYGGYYLDPNTNEVGLSYIDASPNTSPILPRYNCTHPFVGFTPDTEKEPLFGAYPNNAHIEFGISGLDLRALSFIGITFYAPSADTQTWQSGHVVYRHGKIVEETGGSATIREYCKTLWEDARLIPIYPTVAEIEAAVAVDTVWWRQTANAGLGRVAGGYRAATLNPYTDAASVLSGTQNLVESLLSTTPTGSFAACMLGQDFGNYDTIIYSHLLEGTLVETKTTHLAMFNQAYNQSRSYDQYGKEDATYAWGSIAISGGWVY